MKKVKVDGLDKAFMDILEEYGGELTEEAPGIVDNVARECQEAVKTAITSAGIKGKKYKNSIVVDIKKGRYSASAVIHSPKHYQLTHLLEYGHEVKAHGKTYGKTQARPHWRDAEAKATKKLEDELKKVVRK